MSNIRKAIFDIRDLRAILAKLEAKGYADDTPVMIQVDNDSRPDRGEEYSDSLAEVVGHEIIPMPGTYLDQEALILHVEF